MKQLPFIVWVTILCSVGAPNAFVQEQANADKESRGSIGGRIYRSDTNQPIANASIFLLDEAELEAGDEYQLKDVKTDSEGRYLMTDVPAGKYALSVRTLYSSEMDAPCNGIAGAETRSGDQVRVVRTTFDEPMQVVLVKGVTVEAAGVSGKDVDIICRERVD